MSGAAAPDGGAGAAGGPVLLKVLAFSVALTLVFTLVANTLPQVEGEAPAETEVEVGALTMDAFVALGESIFKGKGTCTLCHNDRGRAPDLLALDAVEEARVRLADERYAGGAKDAQGYLRESMLEPSAYVVPGFGKKGTGDTESPMPAVDKPPISLSPVEIDAVIAYLEAKDGHEVTVALPSEAPAAPEAPSAPAGAGAPAPATTPEAVVAKYGCGVCHAILDSRAPVGPPLDDVGARLDAAAIRRSILDPDAEVASGYPPGVMPKDFGDRMTARELEMLVRWLAERKG